MYARVVVEAGDWLGEAEDEANFGSESWLSLEGPACRYMLNFAVEGLTDDDVKDEEGGGDVPEALLFRLRVWFESIDES